MPSVISRELSITYGSYTVGGDQANRILNDVHMSTIEFKTGFVEFTFTIRHDSLAAFNSEIQQATAAFRTPRQNLAVTQSGTKFIDWQHSASTGYNAKPTIIKYGDKDDGGYARWYRIRVEVGLPADVTQTSYRQDSFVNVAYSPSRRRTVTISGTYTANGSTTARGQYVASFDTYAASALNALGGTYKKLEEPQGTADDQNKEINFSATYEEILYTGVGSSDPTLRGEQLTITRNRQSPGDTPNGGNTVERLIHITAVYEAWFNNSDPNLLPSKWEGLRGAVLAAIQGVLTGGSVAVTGESAQFDMSNNKFTITLEVVGSTTNGLLEYTETVTNDIFFGLTLVGVTDGNPWSKFKYGGPGKWQRTVKQEFTSMRSDPQLFQSEAEEPPDGMKKIQISLHRDVSPVRWGIPNYSQKIDARKVTNVKVFEFYMEPQTSVASPGGGSSGGSSSSGGLTGGGASGSPAPGAGDQPSGGSGGGDGGYTPQGPLDPSFFQDFDDGTPGAGGGSGPIPRPGAAPGEWRGND